MKLCEESGILSHLKANKLACHSYMDAGRRLTVRKNQILLLTEMTLVRLSTFYCAQSPSPSSHRMMQRRPGDTSTFSGLLQQRSSRFREPKSSIMGSKHASLFLQRRTLSLFPMVVTIQTSLKRLLEKEDSHYLSYKCDKL